MESISCCPNEVKEKSLMDSLEKPLKIDNILKSSKIGLIVLLVAVVTILHYSTIHGKLGLHIPHRELYFVPILLASYWFGLNFGLVTSLTVSLIYAPHVFINDALKNNILPVSFQIVVFNMVAIMLGLLVEREKRRQEKVLIIEKLAVLGRAALAVGHEMKDLLGALKRIAGQVKGMNSAEVDRDFKIEMSRLEKMVDILLSFVTADTMQLFSHDLNEIVLQRLEHHQKNANKIGVKFEAKLDEGGCPSRVNTETIEWIINQIILNALGVSSKDDTIRIRSERHGKNCRLEIEDEGSGIKSEHMPSIFKPFFTTKKMGQGLALASCRKILLDMGGDIEVASLYGKGATFVLTVPREYSGKPLAADPIATVVKGEKVRNVYRE
jgi:signal transduction histidine kinase